MCIAEMFRVSDKKVFSNSNSLFAHVKGLIDILERPDLEEHIVAFTLPCPDRDAASASADGNKDSTSTSGSYIGNAFTAAAAIINSCTTRPAHAVKYMLSGIELRTIQRTCQARIAELAMQNHRAATAVSFADIWR